MPAVRPITAASPVVARPVRVAAPARAEATPRLDGPKAFEHELIRRTAEAVERYNVRERARQRFALGEIGTRELHAAEADMERAYVALRDLRASVGGPTRLAWRLRHGFDLEAAWRRHGLPLPAAHQPSPSNALAWNVAAGASLAVTMSALAALFLMPAPQVFFVAGPIALVSGLFGGALVLIQGNGLMHAGEAGPGGTPARAFLDADEAHYAGASPAAYRTALIHHATRARMAKEQLAAVKAAGADADRVRLARLELHDAYRSLHGLHGAVSELEAATWKARGFDVEAAWRTWVSSDLVLPPLASLERAPIVPPLDATARKPAQWLGGLIAVVAGAIGADRLGGLAGRALAAIYRIHPLFAIAVVGAAGYFAGGLAVDAMNRLLGPRSVARAPAE